MVSLGSRRPANPPRPLKPTEFGYKALIAARRGLSPTASHQGEETADVRTRDRPGEIRSTALGPQCTLTGRCWLGALIPDDHHRALRITRPDFHHSVGLGLSCCQYRASPTPGGRVAGVRKTTGPYRVESGRWFARMATSLTAATPEGPPMPRAGLRCAMRSAPASATLPWPCPASRAAQCFRSRAETAGRRRS
jgi:hypothetical protein